MTNRALKLARECGLKRLTPTQMLMVNIISWVVQDPDIEKFYAAAAAEGNDHGYDKGLKDGIAQGRREGMQAASKALSDLYSDRADISLIQLAQQHGFRRRDWDDKRTFQATEAQIVSLCEAYHRERSHADTKRLEWMTGCTDGFCYVTGKAKGMHTNGGCRCIFHLLCSSQSEPDKRIQIERLLLKLHKRLIDKESE